MATGDIQRELDASLPDSKALNDASELVADPEGVELEGRRVFIPEGTSCSIVTKAFFKEYRDLGFGTFRVLIAVGEVESTEGGSITPRYCFVTLYYSSECKLLSSDIHLDMR